MKEITKDLSYDPHIESFEKLQELKKLHIPPDALFNERTFDKIDTSFASMIDALLEENIHPAIIEYHLLYAIFNFISVILDISDEDFVKIDRHWHQIFYQVSDYIFEIIKHIILNPDDFMIRQIKHMYTIRIWLTS